jgi:leucyl/phenylalanyl-tRNA---protein transferase
MHSSELTTDLLRQAYLMGYFPMTVDEESSEVHWFEPRERCLFPINGIHVSRSLQRVIRRQEFEVRFDTQFEQVVRNCFREPGNNWLNEDFVRAYTQAHREGWAHCAECWKDGQLVGGIYGLAIGGAFFAESMFHRATNASKVALWSLVETCRSKGFVLFDAQIMNPHLESLGAYVVSTREYRKLLVDATEICTNWSLDKNW